MKAEPDSYMVTIFVEPVGTEIFEGTRLIGESPAVWKAPKGEHELSFQHRGYHEAKEVVTASQDAQVFKFALKKVESKKVATPDLGIKAER